MTEYIKCHECGHKVDKEFADIAIHDSNPDEALYRHKGCGVDNTNDVECMVCNQKFKTITPGHLTKHDITVREYKLRFGPVVSVNQRQRLANQSRGARGGDPELQSRLEGALVTIEAKDVTIVALTEQVNELKESLESSRETISYGGLQNEPTSPNGVVFTMEEMENIGAVALREMVKLKFGRFESRKTDNIEKLRGLVE